MYLYTRLVLLSTLRINGFLDTALLYFIIPTHRGHQRATPYMGMTIISGGITFVLTVACILKSVHNFNFGCAVCFDALIYILFKQLEIVPFNVNFSFY